MKGVNNTDKGYGINPQNKNYQQAFSKHNKSLDPTLE